MKKVQFLAVFFAISTTFSFAQWDQINMSVGRWYHGSAIAEGKLVIAGGTVGGLTPISSVEIYDIESGTWSTAELSEPRAFINPVVHGGKVYFPGGGNFNGGASDKIDIYDARSGTWSIMTLAEARIGVGAVAVGDKLIFAGGGSVNLPVYTATDIVEIYDVSTGEWEHTRMSEGKLLMGVAAVDGKVYFAGGIKSSTEVSDVVDIFDVEANTWTTANLSQARGFLSAAVAGDKILFVGGADLQANDYDVIDIYNTTTGEWTTGTFPQPSGLVAAASLCNKAFFAGGSTVNENFNVEDVYNTLHIYDAATDSWSVEYMEDQKVGAAAATWEGQLFISGGFNWSVGLLTAVDIYTDSCLASRVHAATGPNLIRLFPNPSGGQFRVELPTSLGLPVSLRLLSLDGREVYRGEASRYRMELGLEHLSPGIYFLTVCAIDGAKIAQQRVVISR